jgi:predicted HicB family RNase H-like nuclease
MPDRKTRSVGRPRMKNGMAKGKIVPVRFNDAHLKAMTRKAKQNKQSLSEWIRGTLTAAIEAQ